MTSKKPFHELLGRPPCFEEIGQSPELLTTFQNFLKEKTKDVSDKLASAVDLNLSSKVLDVGGGDGSLAISLVNKYPHVNAGVFDREEVVQFTRKNIEENKLNEKIQAIGGNFLENVPDGFDAITLKHIIHDWDDENSLVILKNCRKALMPGNKLFIIDSIVDRNNPNYNLTVALDFLMLVFFNSKQANIM